MGRLLSSATWKEFRSEHGMNGTEAGQAVSWALRTLIADLRKRNNAAGKNAKPKRKETQW